MRILLSLLLVSVAFAAQATDAEISILDRNFRLQGPCVYVVRNVNNANFECTPDDSFESSYSVDLLKRRDFRRTQQYIEGCRAQSCETETQKLLNFENQIFRGETHFYIVMRYKAVNGNPESTAYKYTICGNDPIGSNPCIEFNSLSNKYIRQVIESNTEQRIEIN